MPEILKPYNSYSDIRLIFRKDAAKIKINMIRVMESESD